MKRGSWTIASALGVMALVLWVAWWAHGLVRLRLLWAERTWMVNPAFGADFWSQSELAARVFATGLDPYDNESHLFHYPPLVIRLFLWVPWFDGKSALRIWIVVCAALVTAGTVVAHRTRRALGIEPVPLSVLLAAVLFSFPVVFQLERANFDLITLAAVLASLPLLRRHGAAWSALAGGVLAVGPWVKLYPGMLGAGLLALRRFWALVGFVAAGIAIGLATPRETLRSFHILGLAIARYTSSAEQLPYPPWAHSLSMVWVEIIRLLPWKRQLYRVPGWVFGGVIVVAAIGFVCVKVFRCRNPQALTYPLFLWILAVASALPVIANDYSLAFLPIAAAAVWSRRDSWLVHACLLASLVWWQPFALPVSGLVLLAVKLLALAAVGACIVRRAAELDASPSTNCAALLCAARGE